VDSRDLNFHAILVFITALFGLVISITLGLSFPKAANAAQNSNAIESIARQPESALGFRQDLSNVPIRFPEAMIVSAHPLASWAGYRALAKGGSALDAAIAAQWMLAVVEPQSSGLGGGGFLLFADPSKNRMFAYDGREQAPSASLADDLRYIDSQDRSSPLPSPRASGRSVGVPGLVALLAKAHEADALLPWSVLLEDAIAVARDGFPISRRLAQSLALAEHGLRANPGAASFWLDAEGRALQEGFWLKQLALANTLERLAREGPIAFYQGPIANAVIREATRVRAGFTPSRMRQTDLNHYRVRTMQPLCTVFLQYQVCGMPPPSSGGLAIAQILGILSQFDVREPSVIMNHRLIEAQRLAYADRDKYVADLYPETLGLAPWGWMLEPDYLRARAGLISDEQSMGTAPAGQSPHGFDLASAPHDMESGTTHVSVIDSQGRAVSLTTSIESSFGSYLYTDAGFFLNNQLTDFSPVPSDAMGKPIANRLSGSKRPRSSMAPTIVLAPGDPANQSLGEVFLVTGTPGGSAIIQYISRQLIAMLAWGKDPQIAAMMPHLGAFNRAPTIVGSEHPAPGIDFASMLKDLERRGHRFYFQPQISGVASIRVRRDFTGKRVLEAGIDPRREGAAAGY